MLIANSSKNPFIFCSKTCKQLYRYGLPVDILGCRTSLMPVNTSLQVGSYKELLKTFTDKYVK